MRKAGRETEVSRPLCYRGDFPDALLSQCDPDHTAGTLILRPIENPQNRALRKAKNAGRIG